MVRNRWSIDRDVLIQWGADLPRDNLAGLLRWSRLALHSGEVLAVYRMEEVPDIGFARAVHGPLAAFLESQPHLDDGILLFERRHRASSRLAVADPTGAVVEQEVTDLGGVLEAAPFQAPVRHRPPLWLHAGPEGTDTIRATISSGSDVWLPWCSASYELDADTEEFVDNTALASRHTPRLNQWLAQLREYTLQLGGTWALDRMITDRDLLFEVDDQGVRLDAEQPFVRSSEVPVSGLGNDSVPAALRAALDWFRIEPPPPPYRAVIRAAVFAPGHELYTADRSRVLHALRHPDDPSSALTADELRQVDLIDVDNQTGRHSFSSHELLDRPADP